MHKFPLWIVTIAMFITGVVFLSCQSMETPAVAQKTAMAMTEPKVSLEFVEIPQYYGYWYFNNKVTPTKGDPGNYGAPLPMAFIFNLENPNAEPVKLEGFKFTIAFDGIDVNTVFAMETQWIPAGKTNQLRVNAMFDVQQTLLTLMLPGAPKVKAMGVTPWDLLEKWWKGAQTMNFNVEVKEGAATFIVGKETQVVGFAGTFGGK